VALYKLARRANVAWGLGRGLKPFEPLAVQKATRVLGQAEARGMLHPQAIVPAPFAPKIPAVNLGEGLTQSRLPLNTHAEGPSVSTSPLSALLPNASLTFGPKGSLPSGPYSTAVRAPTGPRQRAPSPAPAAAAAAPVAAAPVAAAPPAVAAPAPPAVAVRVNAAGATQALRAVVPRAVVPRAVAPSAIRPAPPAVAAPAPPAVAAPAPPAAAAPAPPAAAAAAPAAAAAAPAAAAAAETPPPVGWGWKAPAAVLGSTALLGGAYMAGRAQANEHDPRYQKYAGYFDRIGGAIKSFKSFQPAQHALASQLPTQQASQGLLSQVRGRWGAATQTYRNERAADQAVSGLKTQQAGLRKQYDALPAAEQAAFVQNQQANPSPGWGLTPQQHLQQQNIPVPQRYQSPEPASSSSSGSTFGWKAPVAIGGTVLAGTAAYRAGQNASEQEARMRDLNSARQHQLYSAPPSMTVLASYDEFAKTAMPRPMGPLIQQSSGGVPNQMDRALRDAVAREMAQSMVSQPINALGDLVQKKLYDEPKYRATYEKAIASDPMLAQYAQEKPDALRAVHKSLTRFAPSVAKDPAATRSFLRSSMMAGGELDFATIRLLAETEKFVQNAKGKGVP